jgi:hypothetical protein
MKQAECLASLAEIRKGALVSELDSEYQRAVQEAQKTGQKATVTLTLEVTPYGENSIYLNGAASVKLPKVKSKPTLFFVTPEGKLTRQDPGQLEITALRVVDGT